MNGKIISDIDLHGLLEFHRSHGKPATLTAVRPPARYGHLEFKEQQAQQNGNGIEITSQSAIKLEASQDMNLETSAQLNIKGSMVNIN